MDVGAIGTGMGGLSRQDLTGVRSLLPEALPEYTGQRPLAPGGGKGEAREAAEEFVAGALVLPVLKQLRETSSAWGPFAPGQHEKTFGGLLDQEIASRIVQASNFGLVDRLAHDLLKHSGWALDVEA